MDGWMNSRIPKGSMVYMSIQHMYSDCSHGPESDSRHLPVLPLKLIYTCFTSNFTTQVAERVMEYQPCTKCKICTLAALFGVFGSFFDFVLMLS